MWFHVIRTPRSIYASYLMYVPMGTGEMILFQIYIVHATLYHVLQKKNDQHLLQLNHQIFMVTP